MQTVAKSNGIRLRPITVLLALSLLIHAVILIVIALNSGEGNRSLTSSSQTLTVKLKTPVPEKKPQPKPAEPAQKPPVAEEKQKLEKPEKAVHLPRHNAEKTDLNGTGFDAPVTENPVKGREPGPKPSVEKQEKNTQLAEGRSEKPEASKKPETPRKPEPKNTRGQAAESVTTTAKATPSTTSTAEKPLTTSIKASSQQSDPAKMTAPDKKALTGDDVPQGMKVVSDKELAGTKIGEPFSEIEARRIRMVNRYLERMQKQVRAHFRPPVQMNVYREGVVIFELGPSGYLQLSRLAHSSGNSLLDASALEAVRSVPRFDVPESRAVAARYYRNLTFHFSAGDQ